MLANKKGGKPSTKGQVGFHGIWIQQHELPNSVVYSVSISIKEILLPHLVRDATKLGPAFQFWSPY